MPKDISSSSSEDEADSVSAEPPAKEKQTGQHTSGFQCPAEFVPVGHPSCSSTRAKSLSKKQHELWLIKAPDNFNPQSISGIQLSLSGVQTVKVPAADGAESGQRIFSVTASAQVSSELRLLTGDEQSLRVAPSFSGLLNVSETFGGGGSHAPHVIPAAPVPTIPPGLKQRFFPFGSNAPTLTSCVSEADGAAFTPSSTTLKHVSGQEGDKERTTTTTKKKKKKKEKRIKTEPESEIHVKLEPEIQEVVMTAGVVSQEKLKRKRDREGEGEGETGVEVKNEPMDTLYGDTADGSAKKKKKKKKKKSRTDDD